jgi:Phytanoyl-CoA dioxygenase (PhyH)
MMAIESIPSSLHLTSGGIELDRDPAAFGFLRESNDVLGDADALRGRMEEDGYLYLPGFFKQAEVREARLAICEALAGDGLIDLNYPLEDAVAVKDAKVAFRPDILRSGKPREALERVIYGPKIMEFYSGFLGGPAAHFDFTWLRAISPGLGSYPHCDVVFMGRGTKNLYTAWVPLGDVPLHVGGLILVEGSHKDQTSGRAIASTTWTRSAETSLTATRLRRRATENGV